MTTQGRVHLQNRRPGMSKHFRVRHELQSSSGNQGQASKVSALMRRIVELERDQKADEARIDAVIRKAEREIANLQQRHLAPDALWSAIAAIRDKTVLMSRDVRKNMHSRTVIARGLQETLGNDFLSQSTRFAADDVTDASLRTQFFKLLQRTPTPALLDHLKDAIQSGNFACAESIRFEFKCRADRHLYSDNFEAIKGMLSVEDPAEMQIRLVAIANAAVKVDRRVTNLLQRRADALVLASADSPNEVLERIS
jgi:hypothetical protein